ncbi:hypothetical protein [Kitasatospora mediocidica]|uniref:hypothetical protein n=1 Tax=Kitasatospora mediocidica TaxID=58352 RepID=UPI00056B53C5|nr:hypothetical protein [Kitasatospora mediocidica]
MTQEMPELIDGLAELTNAPAPASAVSAERAMQVGRGRRRRRQLAAAATTTAVAVVAALGLGFGLPGDSHPAVPAGSPFAPDRAAFVAAQSGADPAMADATFGWLPPSITGVGQQLGAAGGMAVARAPGLTSTRIMLSLYPAGPVPTVGSADTGGALSRLDAPAVNGRTAYWLVSGATAAPGDDDLFLCWQTADGSWAVMHGYYLKESDNRAAMLRVAAGVTVGLRPIPLPVRIGKLPAGARLTGVTLERPSDDVDSPTGWELLLEYDVHGTKISVASAPAQARRLLGGSENDCRSEAGIVLCVDAPPGSTVLDPLGGMQGWLKKMTVLGLSESNWTTKVVG